MGFFSKKSAPVSLDAMLSDQAARYGISVDEYRYGMNNDYTPGNYPSSDGTYQRGNPFFTQTNQPTMGSLHSTNIQRPFMWQGNNRSARTAVQNAYNDYWNNYGKNTDQLQQATWQGPEIRPEYMGGGEQANGLSHLGTPGYWQDNNHDHVFNASVDDSLNGSMSPGLDHTPQQPPQLPQMPNPQTGLRSIGMTPPQSQSPQQDSPIYKGLQDFFTNIASSGSYG